jgi:hypothetical protein
MDQKCFVETGNTSFFGEYLYAQVVPADHFLRKLLERMDWKHFTGKLIKLYKGEGMVGRPPFDPALILKMERLARVRTRFTRHGGETKDAPAEWLKYLSLIEQEKRDREEALLVFDKKKRDRKYK